MLAGCWGHTCATLLAHGKPRPQKSWITQPSIRPSPHALQVLHRPGNLGGLMWTVANALAT